MSYGRCLWQVRLNIIIFLVKKGIMQLGTFLNQFFFLKSWDSDMYIFINICQNVRYEFFYRDTTQLKQREYVSELLKAKVCASSLAYFMV